MSQSSGQLKSHAQAMNTAINAVNEAITELGRVNNNVESAAGALRSGWNGDAASAYQNGIALWQSDYQQIINLMSGLHDNLVTNKQTWESVEDYNASVAR